MASCREANETSTGSHWFVINIPMVSHWCSSHISSRNHWNDGEIPMERQWDSIEMQSTFHWNASSISRILSEWMRQTFRVNTSFARKRLITKIPSLSPVTPLKSFAVKRLRHGRDVRCPSRIPPVLGPFTNLVRGLNYSIRQIRFLKAIGGFEVEKGRETGVIFNVSPVASALCISMFQLCDGSKGG